MKRFSKTLLAGLRLSALLKPAQNTPLNGFGTFLALMLAGLVVYATVQMQAAIPPKVFSPNGLQSFATESLLLLCTAWALATLGGRDARIFDAASPLFIAGIVVGSLYFLFASWIAPSIPENEITFIYALRGGFFLWWILILVRLEQYLGVETRLRLVCGALIGFSLSAFPWIYELQNQKLWLPATESTLDAGVDTADDDLQETVGFDAEAVIYDQPRLMKHSIEQLAPRTPGKVNLYMIAFAGDGEENVFRNEVEFVETQFQQRFGAVGHILVLENNADTVERRPIASLTNLQAAIDAVSEKMDPQEDILFLYITSHGSKEHEIYVSLDPLPLNQIDPDSLAEALRRTPIRWKVIVISACYSGGFINALKNSTSLIITAARADRASFGCGADSDITYFGKAFFIEAMNQNDNFLAAFAQADNTISEWEDREQREHSFPQMASTPLIQEKLKAWRNGLRIGPAVPFAPAAANSAASQE